MSIEGTGIMCGKTNLNGVRVGEVSTSVVSVFILRFSHPSLFLQSRLNNDRRCQKKDDDEDSSATG